jgi:hypothetical protein
MNSESELKKSYYVRLVDWVLAFVQEFRYEASKLKPHEKEWLKPYVKEQILTKACQVEVLKFGNPYRLVLLFFLDGTKQDLLIKIHRKKWATLDATVGMFLDKYSALNLKHEDMYRLLKDSIGGIRNPIYGIDCTNNVGCIFFSHDVLVETFLFPWKLVDFSNPQKMAEMIFYLNLGQASMATESTKWS